MFKPRPKQQEVLNYGGGKMGVAAVPGSGKTRTLSYLAARLIAESPLEEGQEILVVTLVNSAVGHFARQVAEFIRERDLLPGMGYRVRTLHGLANDIVRERPGLAGLSDDFMIIDEREANDILQNAADAWVRTNADMPLHYLQEKYFDSRNIRGEKWVELVRDVAGNFIRQAKDMMLTPDKIRELMAAYRRELPLVEMCVAIYETYEYGLRYRGGVDFQDLIRLALQILRLDADYLKRLQHRWPYILEDEAQDSSELQEAILRALTGKSGNWVRVGDPNQAIFETFTTANPRFLRGFLKEKGVQARELPNSGRSTLSVIRLANALIDWSLRHPNRSIREKEPLSLPMIEPTPIGDPQGNPPDNPDMVHVVGDRFTSDQERDTVVKSLLRWLPKHQDSTVAVLLPINSSGSKMVEVLRDAGIDYVENLRSTTSTRAVVGSITRVLFYLQSPHSSDALGSLYETWRRDDRDDPEAAEGIKRVKRLLRDLENVEDYVVPRLYDWLEETVIDDDALHNHLAEFRGYVQRWMQAASLPVDQLVLTIAADLFTAESDIATAYSLALYLRRFGDSQPDTRLPEFIAELKEIALNRRKFTGISDDDNGFDPEKHKGKVTVTTMHKAKGLEWDRVYLMSLSNYDFPSADVYDSFMSEKWFIRDGLNLDAEARAQLKCLTTGEPYKEGDATYDARIEYASERLRLLYVGITRAKEELIMTWNSGSRGDNQQAAPMVALQAWWEKNRYDD